MSTSATAYEAYSSIENNIKCEYVTVREGTSADAKILDNNFLR